jgi:hypothetical protein
MHETHFAYRLAAFQKRAVLIAIFQNASAAGKCDKILQQTLSRLSQLIAM